MLRLTIVCVVAASLAGLFINQAWARGRSFPIEVTGIIAMVDRRNQTFTIQVDEPASILTIAVGRDCKFTQNGVSAGERILKKGARVRVSYFSTIFTGKIAVKIESNPVPEVKTGIIEKIEPFDRKLTLRIGVEPRHLVVRWASNACFFKAGRAVSVADLRKNAATRVSYFSPAFESKYAVKIELEPAF
jgi:hypothetical protein